VTKLSIAFQTNKPLSTYAALAELVEGYNFDTITLYEDLMFQPAWAPLHVIAQNTRRVRLGPAVVNPYLRHPAIIAGEFALLNEMARGRAYLGLGRGAFLDALKLDQPQPITAVKETVEIVQRLLSGDRSPYHGQLFSATEEATFRWQPPYRQAPILIGTWGTPISCPSFANISTGARAVPAAIRPGLGLSSARSPSSLKIGRKRKRWLGAKWPCTCRWLSASTQP
jgi:5,10-methylenetetrahydromethanopterin reductase